jgi:cell cycle sensor histidine kinase DivJ
MAGAAAGGRLAAVGIVSALLYATGLALGAESLARTSFWLLYAEEDRYRLLARNMTDVITRHGAHGAVLFASPAAETLFGAPVRELLGHGLFDRVHVADRPAYLTALAHAAQGNMQSVEFRVRRDAPGAFFVWIEMRCRPLDHVGAADRAREVVAVMRDVSERKAQEQALQEARALAEQGNAMKTRFLATMSHELRTPLNAIIGFSEMLTRDDALRIDADKRREYARLINESGSHLLSVVNGILDMSKMETGDFEIVPEPFAPGDVIGHCCDILALKARNAGVEMRKAIPADLPEITADKRAVRQILINVISNAIKFSDRGSHVTVSACLAGADLHMIVEDCGIGIAASDLKRIGEPFFQARSTYDRRHDGTGLGLSIVKGLVALHGGALDLRSTLGRGTRVTVSLPLDCEHRRPAADKSNIAHPAFAAGVRAEQTELRKRA